MLTQERLKQLLNYDPETGIFTRIISVSSNALKGDIAGWINGHGYRQLSIDYKKYDCHRLAFLYMLGKLPNEEVDHINHIRSDNRWINLREVTRHENKKNLSFLKEL